MGKKSLNPNVIKQLRTSKAYYVAKDTAYFMYDSHKARIMSISEGYVMARLKGCMPFVVSLKEALKNLIS